MRLAYLAVAVTSLALVPACTLYWPGGDDDDIICPQTAGDRAPEPGLLDPFNLQCEFFGGGGGCDPTPLAGAEADALAMPSWGSCASACLGLDEYTCATTAACRTAYDDACLLTDGPCPLLTPFLGCYPVDTTGPVQGACNGLDAWECSRHDDCLATYAPGPGCRDGVDSDGDGVIDDSDECIPQFRSCLPELVPQCPPNADCG